jgi:hypothetical protein
MIALERRLRRLAASLAPERETDYTRRLRARIEEARRRLADARARGDVPPLDTAENEREDLSGLTVIEILHRGRARAAARSKWPGQAPHRPSRDLSAGSNATHE